MRRHLFLLAITSLVLAAAAGCSTASDAATDGASGRVAALSVIDAVGFHGIDESLGKGEAINAQWLGKVRHGQIAVASASWPQDLQQQAKAFNDAAQKLAIALEADNASAAALAAKDAHVTQHELSTEGWETLAKEAGIQLASHDEGAATATPKAH